MKSTGIVRRIDDLGRVVIPKEVRRHLSIHEGDPLEIYTLDNCVIFQKYYVSTQKDVSFVRYSVPPTYQSKIGVILYDCGSIVSCTDNMKSFSETFDEKLYQNSRCDKQINSMLDRAIDEYNSSCNQNWKFVHIYPLKMDNITYNSSTNICVLCNGEATSYLALILDYVDNCCKQYADNQFEDLR